jgi:hypothetical protein
MHVLDTRATILCQLYRGYDRLCSLLPIDWFNIFLARRQRSLEKEETNARRFGTNGIVPRTLRRGALGAPTQPLVVDQTTHRIVYAQYLSKA